MWVYEQKTGILRDPEGQITGHGYSGKGAGKNEPEMESFPNVGPIPTGLYRIGAPRQTAAHGPYALDLTPDSANQMHGRSAFLMHGDSIPHPGTASEGCIIMPRNVREAVWQSGSHVLMVIATL